MITILVLYISQRARRRSERLPSYPAAYTCKNPDTPEKGYPDYRNTLYWNPCVSIPAGESLEFEGRVPEYCIKENIPLVLFINGL